MKSYIKYYMPVILIICTVLILTKLVHFQFKMYLIKQVSPSKQVSAENGNWNFFSTLVHLAESNMKNLAKKKKSQQPNTTRPPSIAEDNFSLWKIMSALLLSYWLGGTTLPDTQQKSMFENILQKPARKSLTLKENKFSSLNLRALPLPSVGWLC